MVSGVNFWSMTIIRLSNVLRFSTEHSSENSNIQPAILCILCCLYKVSVAIYVLICIYIPVISLYRRLRSARSLDQTRRSVPPAWIEFFLCKWCLRPLCSVLAAHTGWLTFCKQPSRLCHYLRHRAQWGRSVCHLEKYHCSAHVEIFCQ